MSTQELPPGWDEARIKAVIAHHEAQSEDQRAADIEAALASDRITWMAVPVDRVPEVRALLAREASA